MFQHILVPVDGSECAIGALDVAAKFAREQGAKVTLCCVMEPQNVEYALAYATPQTTAGLFEALRDDAIAILAEAKEQVAPLATDGAIREGPCAEQIVKTAEERGCDLIVMGSHGRRGVSHFFLGSVAEGVLRQAPVPVLIVRLQPLRVG
jgi:nucleotide-binding universal stress UspA family protein